MQNLTLHLLCVRAGENGRVLVTVPGKAKAGAKISGKAGSGQNHRGEGFWSVQGTDFVDAKGRKVCTCRSKTLDGEHVREKT